MGGLVRPRTDVVSIVIPCFNQGRFLKQAIESALTQTYEPIEVVVVDDGSTDDTCDIASSYLPRIIYRFQQNRGHGAARNAGSLAATGEFLHFLDADDAIAPDVIERHLAYAEQHPDYDVFYGAWQSMDVDGNLGRLHKTRALGADPFHALLRNYLAPPACITVRRSLFERSGRFDERLTASEDWDLWLKMAAAGAKFIKVPSSVSHIRRYAGMISRDYDAMWATGLEVLSRYRQRHVSCLRCRIAAAIGLQKLRGNCCRRCLMPEYKRLVAEGARGEAMSHVMSAIRHDPATAIVLPRVMFTAGVRSLFGRDV